MSVLAVVLQIFGVLALIVCAGLAVNWWAAGAVAGIVALMFGDALERR